MGSFNSIAPFYDKLKYLVFGNKLDLATNTFLKDIPEKSHILIAGGGTGKLLASLKISHTVDYIEASHKMIEMAKKRNFTAKVNFVHADIITFLVGSHYDVIITPFFLDCFSFKELQVAFDHLSSLLKPKGVWIHTDFYPKSKGQKFLIQFMYLCFRISSGLKVKKLADFDKIFLTKGFIEKKKVASMNSMVYSIIYTKID